MNSKGMKFCHVNTRSLYSKLNELELFFDDTDVLCCSETWLDNRFSNDMIGLSNKSVFRCDRRKDVLSYNSRPTAGGVCIYVNNTLVNYTVCVEEFTCITPDYEILTIFTSRPDHRFFVTTCVYKPPKGKLSECIKFLKPHCKSC